MATRYAIYFLVVAVMVGVKQVDAQQVSLIVPLGHSEVVQAAGFSSDDRYVVTGAADRTVMIWETFTGRKLRQLDNHPGIIRYAKFSPASDFIITGTDSVARLWAVPSYKLKASYPAVKRACFSGDGKKLFVTDPLGKVRQINLQTLKAELTYSDTVLDEGITTSTDSKLLGITTASRFLVRDTKTGKVVLTTIGNGKPLSCFFAPDSEYFITVTNKGIQRFNIKKGYSPLNFINAPCDTVMRSRNGKWLLQVRKYEAGFTVWDFINYRRTAEVSGGISVYDSISVYSPEVPDSIIKYHTGELPFRFPMFLGKTAVEISDDGNFIRCSNMLINLASLRSSRMFENELDASSFTIDSKYLLTQREPGIITLSATGDTKDILQYRSHADNIRNTDVSPDNRLFLTTGLDSIVRVVEVETGRTLLILRHPAIVSRAVFSKDGSQVLTNCYDTTARIWSSVNGDLLRSFPGSYPNINPAWFGKNDSVVVNALTVDSVQRFNMNGEPEGMLALEPELVDPETELSRISPTGRYWLGDIRYGTTFLGDDFGENQMVFKTLYPVFAFSPRDKLLVLSDGINDSLFVVDIEANRILPGIRIALDSERAGLTKSISQLVFVGSRLFVTCSDRSIKVLEMPSGKKIASLSGRFVASHSGNRYFTVANGGACSIYDTAGLKLLYTYIAIDSTNSMTVDPDFRFEGTAASKKLVYYVCGNEVVGLDQLKATSWEPDLVKKIMTGAKSAISATKVTALEICNTTPVVKPGGYTKGAFNYSITPQRGGIGKIQLLVNGKIVKTYSPQTLPRQGSAVKLSVPAKAIDSFFVSGSSNAVSVKATTIKGSLNSGEATIEGFAADGIFGQPRLFLLSIGIGKYSGDPLNLKYPASDAAKFAAALSSAARKLLNTDTNGEEHVFSYIVNTDSFNTLRPTRYTILSILDSIRSKARADDILVVFFAGHGMLLPGSKQELLLPTAEAESANQVATQPAKVAISFSELMKRMQQIKANKEILILDVCNSGRAVDEMNEATKRDIPPDQQRILDNLAESTGSCIFAAAAAGQPAYEANLYGQGLLSYSLLSTLKLGSGLSSEKFIQVNHWFDESTDQVKQLAEKIGNWQTPKVFGNANFVIGIVDKDIAGGIQVKTPRKVFGKSELRLDSDIPWDKLGISAQVDDELKSLTGEKIYSGLSFQPGYKGVQYFVRGKYILKGDTVEAKIFIVKSNEETRPVFEFTVTGSANKTAEVVNAISQQVVERMNVE